MNKKENMSMKNSNIKWIGIIPQGWEIKRFKNYFTNIGGGNYGYDLQENSKIKLTCFSISDFKNGNLDNKNKDLIKTNRAYDKENILKKGVILVEKSGGGEKTPVGRMVIVKEDVKAYYTNFVQGIKINNKMNENFILYILKTTYNLRLHMKYVKQNTGLQNFKFNNFANDLLIPVPKLEVQNKIVNFIDYNLITLSKKIKKYNKKIELLKEYKEALIYETVTKGLDKNVEMKDSGVDWIASIPRDWSIKRVKDCIVLQGGGSDKKINKDEKEVSLINYTDVYKNKKLDKNLNYMKVTYPEDKIKKIQVYKNDLLITPTSETADDIGKVNIVLEEMNDTVFSYHILRMRAFKNSCPFYLKYYFNSIASKLQFNKKATGITRVTLSRNDILSNKIVLPPLNEQNKIVYFLDKKTEEIDNEVEKLYKKIELIKELKESIIYECVTGKLDIEKEGEKYQKIIESI